MKMDDNKHCFDTDYTLKKDLCCAKSQIIYHVSYLGYIFGGVLVRVLVSGEVDHEFGLACSSQVR
jgi:hypothetical protein